ncbi:MAG TPA: hypothetical protein VF184_10085 [Phycisphaeraceae bacterium]
MQPRCSRGRLVWGGLLALGLTAWTATPAVAINVVLDYTHDTFFSSHPTAKAALEAAAQDISNVIITSLNPTVDTVQGQEGSATVTFDWELTYKNPSTGGSQTFDPVELPADEVRLFVGVRRLTGNTLGQGGPGDAINAGINGSWVNLSDRQAALTQGAALSSANLGRGGGPTIGTLSDSFDGDPYSVSFGSMLGNLWFDVDTNNDGSTDSDDTLNNYWHFDHTAPVASGKYDFYSVALHEILHAIGFGTSQTWNDLAIGDDWLGSNVIAMRGTGESLVATSGHIADGILSTNIVNGTAQEVAMDPNLTIGQRKYLTLLDLAFLADIGWDVAVPEPAAAGLMTLSLMLTLRQRRTRPQA